MLCNERGRRGIRVQAREEGRDQGRETGIRTGLRGEREKRGRERERNSGGVFSSLFRNRFSLSRDSQEPISVAVETFCFTAAAALELSLDDCSNGCLILHHLRSPPLDPDLRQRASGSCQPFPRASCSCVPMSPVVAYVRQLRLLLRHKLLLRKRQPVRLSSSRLLSLTPASLSSCPQVILGLEVLWPTLVFLSVFFVKLQFPVTEHPTCESGVPLSLSFSSRLTLPSRKGLYTARALPSAGPLHFVQLFACTIDNPCLDSASYQEVPTFPKAR